MTATHVVKDRVWKFYSNKGHVRLLVVLYVAWVAITTWAVWNPLPSATMAPDIFGNQDVAACNDVVLDHDDCVADENSKAAAIAVVFRIMIVFLLPLVFTALIILAMFIQEWVREGYKNSN